MTSTLAQVIDAVETVLSAAPSLARSESYDELTEGIEDLPMLMVYPESNATDSTGQTDRTSFGGRGGAEDKPTRVKNYVIMADLYAAQRAVLGQDMSQLVETVNELEIILEDQDVKPYFGLADIKSFNWSWNRVTLVYTDPEIKYVGARFVIGLKIY